MVSSDLRPANHPALELPETPTLFLFNLEELTVLNSAQVAYL
jgi:hypothetical protein